MKTTATRLVTYSQCPFLYRVLYEVREPLPVLGTRRLFGNAIHAAIAAYERSGRSMDCAIETLDERGRGLNRQDRDEARSILVWQHERAVGREGKPILIEGSLRASIAGHRLEVRMDRLDAVGEDLLLAEYKGGKSFDVESIRVQLMILSYAIFDVFKRAPRHWEIEFLRSRRVLNVPAEVSPRRLEEFTGDLVNGVTQPLREPVPYDPKFCRSCPARPFCPRHHSRPKEFSKVPAPQSTQAWLF